jgi:formylmethanofuran:tetrahydromethanopterin formyltransferase
LHNDAEVNQWYKDNFNKSVAGLLNISEHELKKMRQICKAVVSQKKHIYDHASEAGIERFLDIQITPKAAERVRKLLALVDIQPYLNDWNELLNKERKL